MMTTPWSVLPLELKLGLIDLLDHKTVHALATVDKSTRAICIPNCFKHVSLRTCDAMRSFLSNVPSYHCRHILRVQICTKMDTSTQDVLSPTDALIMLLNRSTQLQHLSIRIVEPLDKEIISSFSKLFHLVSFSISDSGDSYDVAPLSERLVVSMAASVPALQELDLECITRSRLHAQELEGVYPYIPLVSGDEDIEDHPLLGSELSLPSLMRIPSLRKLAIRGSHFDDPRWKTTPVLCRIESLNLGAVHSDALYVQRIVLILGSTIRELSLDTTLSDGFAQTPPGLLGKIHLGCHFAYTELDETLRALAGSPIESISLQTFQDDLADAYGHLKDFLDLRVKRGADSYYSQLRTLHVTLAVWSSEDEADEESVREKAELCGLLEDLCRESRLTCIIADTPELHRCIGRFER